jgi:hypothetical protein
LVVLRLQRRSSGSCVTAVEEEWVVAVERKVEGGVSRMTG